MGAWKLTIRRGPRVERERFDSAEEAVAGAERRLQSIRREGGLPAVTMLREFTPDQRVHARVEISGPGLLCGPEGGIDLMGDGALIFYSGAIRKRPLEPAAGESPYEALRRELERR